MKRNNTEPRLEGIQARTPEAYERLCHDLYRVRLGLCQLILRKPRMHRDVFDVVYASTVILVQLLNAERMDYEHRQGHCR